MSGREVRLELAVGRRVRAKNGRSIGRLEEVRADDRWIVTGFLIGPGAFLERVGMQARGLIGFKIQPRGYRARWDQVDLSDPRRPRLTCPLEELARLEDAPSVSNSQLPPPKETAREATRRRRR